MPVPKKVKEERRACVAAHKIKEALNPPVKEEKVSPENVSEEALNSPIKEEISNGGLIYAIVLIAAIFYCGFKFTVG